MANEDRDRRPQETVTNTGGLETPGTLADGSSGRLPSPDSAIDRYVVGEELGAGGMGVVYRAYDPELDRNVALKFLHRALGSERYRARLRREARAMAQLRHPNVVSVYDIGEHDGVTWLAMEHVEGSTLREHMQDHGSWPRVKPLFLAAGRGLAAAHAVGLVHRDFKPENVLIDARGVAHVADFGLAHFADAAEPVSGTDGPVAETNQLTLTGSTVGTPRYMAPEQHEGRAVSDATDQFAFCVALYETLWGRPPFAGKTLGELRESVVRGKVQAADPAVEVPGHIRDAVLQGLRVDPAQRHPSMEALLAELERDPGVRRRRAVRAGALALLVVATAASIAVAVVRGGGAPAAEACPLETGALDGIWDPGRRAVMTAAFEASRRGYARGALDRVTRGLDARSGEWLELRRAACRARLVDRVDSEELYQQKVRCLDAWRSRLRGLTDALATGVTDEVIARSPRAVAALPRLSDCTDGETLSTATLYADDPRIAPVLADLDRAFGAVPTMDAGAADELSGQVLARAQEIGTPAILGRAQLLRGRVLDNAGRERDAIPVLQEATRNLAEARHDDSAAHAAQVLYGIAVTLEDGDRADSLLIGARAAAARVPARSTVHANLLVDQGRDLRRRGKLTEALPLYERAVAIRRERLGADHPDVAAVYHNMAAIHIDRRDFETAEPLLRRSIAILERAYGPDHPELIDSLGALAVLYFESGRRDEESAVREQALELSARSLGKETLSHASLLRNHGVFLGRSGQPERALAVLTESLEIARRVGGERHPAVARTLMSMGDQLSELGRSADGISRYREALEVLAEDDPWRGVALINLADTYGEGKDWTRACAASQEAHDVLAGTVGTDHPFMLYALFGLTRCKLETGAATAAIALAETGLRVAEETEASAFERGMLEFFHGRALWESGRDRHRGVAQVRAARARLASAEDDQAAEAVADADAWLRRRAR